MLPNRFCSLTARPPGEVASSVAENASALLELPLPGSESSGGGDAPLVCTGTCAALCACRLAPAFTCASHSAAARACASIRVCTPPPVDVCGGGCVCAYGCDCGCGGDICSNARSRAFCALDLPLNMDPNNDPRPDEELEEVADAAAAAAAVALAEAGCAPSEPLYPICNSACGGGTRRSACTTATKRTSYSVKAAAAMLLRAAAKATAAATAAACAGDFTAGKGNEVACRTGNDGSGDCVAGPLGSCT